MPILQEIGSRGNPLQELSVDVRSVAPNVKTSVGITWRSHVYYNGHPVFIFKRTFQHKNITVI